MRLLYYYTICCLTNCQIDDYHCYTPFLFWAFRKNEFCELWVLWSDLSVNVARLRRYYDMVAILYNSVCLVTVNWYGRWEVEDSDKWQLPVVERGARMNVVVCVDKLWIRVIIYTFARAIKSCPAIISQCSNDMWMRMRENQESYFVQWASFTDKGNSASNNLMTIVNVVARLSYKIAEV